MAKVMLQDVNKRFGSHQVLFDVSLDVADGEFTVFVGPSGCGKSTLLRAIAGLERVTSGRIDIGERDVTNLAPSDRDVAMVFQSYALYPHMTVRENMDFGMRINGFAPEERDRRLADAARILQLGEYMDRKPSQLSGGQRQRVAIGRAIVKNPKVFLFDEPLSNLDAKLRVQMRVELQTLHRQLKATMIYVTHDQIEAMTMADRIVVLNKGRIEQIGRPSELYNAPMTEFVAGFIGAPAMNIFNLGTGLPAFAQRLPANARRLGIRPEHVVIEAAGKGPITAKVQITEHLGADVFLHAQLPDGQLLVVRAPGDTQAEIGRELSLSFPPDRTHFFDTAGQSIRLPS